MNVPLVGLTPFPNQHGARTLKNSMVCVKAQAAALGASFSAHLNLEHGGLPAA